MKSSMPGVLTKVCSLHITQAWPDSGDSRMPILQGSRMAMTVQDVPGRNRLIETLDPKRQ